MKKCCETCAAWDIKAQWASVHESTDKDTAYCYDPQASMAFGPSTNKDFGELCTHWIARNRVSPSPDYSKRK